MSAGITAVTADHVTALISGFAAIMVEVNLWAVPALPIIEIGSRNQILDSVPKKQRQKSSVQVLARGVQQTICQCSAL